MSPIFRYKSTERVFVCLIILIVFFFMYQVGCNKSKINMGGVELTPQNYLDEKEKRVNEKTYEFENQINEMNQYLNDDLSKTLKDSIANLIYQRQKDVNEAEFLLNGFQNFKGKSADGQELFLRSVQDFLSKEKNPNAFIDYGIRTKEMMSNLKIQNLMADTTNKNIEIQQWKDEATKILNDKQKLEGLYSQNLNYIRQMELIINKFKEDSVSYSNLLNDMNFQNTSLKTEQKKLQDELNSYNPVRITKCTFTSPSCRSKKDESYIVSCMNKLELKFTMLSNIKSINNNEVVKVIFTLPTKDPSKSKVKEISKSITIGEETTFVFEDNNYDFIAGLIQYKYFMRKPPLLFRWKYEKSLLKSCSQGEQRDSYS